MTDRGKHLPDELPKRWISIGHPVRLRLVGLDAFIKLPMVVDSVAHSIGLIRPPAFGFGKPWARRTSSCPECWDKRRLPVRLRLVRLNAFIDRVPKLAAIAHIVALVGLPGWYPGAVRGFVGARLSGISGQGLSHCA